MLQAGGSAVDAAVAAGFAAAVAEPALSSLGGGGFLLDVPTDGPPRLVDFFVDVPGLGRSTTAAPTMTPVTVRFSGADQVFSVGWGSVAVPGCLAGYLFASRRRGRLPLADVVAPARRLARDGVHLDASQAAVVLLLEDILTLTPEGRGIFRRDGRLLHAGDRLTNPELADFLDALADGRVPDLGAVAGQLDAAMRAGQGAVTRADLDAYAVVERDPLRLAYRDGVVLSNPPPSFGAGLVLGGLRGLAAAPPLDASPGAVERYVRQLVAMSGRHVAGPAAVRGTTHVSVVDGDGNLAAMTTSNGSCSGVYIPGTGIQLNNMMGEADLHPAGPGGAGPGARVGSMMMPTVVQAADGTVVALGSGGSERIPSAMARVLTAVLDLDLPLPEAVESPRLHWDRSLLQVEPGLPDEVFARLARIWPVHEWERPELYFGGVHAVVRRPDGTVGAVGDHRRGGASAVISL